MSIPNRKQIRDLFEGLLGRDVDVSDGAPPPLDVVPRPLVASYIDDVHNLSSVVVMDFELAAYSAAALALVPRGGAEAAIEDGLLPTSLFENASEILNIVAGIINDAGEVHQRLQQVYGPSDPLPGSVASWAATLGSREDVTVDIQGYGEGVIGVVSTL